MKIKLVSDYHDWWDHAFFPDGDLAYTRNQRGAQSRAEMFNYLESLGFATPAHGTAKVYIPTQIHLLREQGFVNEPEIKLAHTIEKPTTDQLVEIELKQLQRELYEEQARVVVHTDEYAHCGEGKQLMTYEEALQGYPDAFVVQYMPTSMDRASLSERLLFIGEVGFHLQYASDDWRSNVGDVEIAVTQRFHFDVLATMMYPIYAIDFITNKNLAIDFNTAPGLDAVKKYITATEIYDQVEAWYEIHQTEQVS